MNIKTDGKVLDDDDDNFPWMHVLCFQGPSCFISTQDSVIKCFIPNGVNIDTLFNPTISWPKLSLFNDSLIFLLQVFVSFPIICVFSKCYLSFGMRSNDWLTPLLLIPWLLNTFLDNFLEVSVSFKSLFYVYSSSLETSLLWPLALFEIFFTIPVLVIIECLDCISIYVNFYYVQCKPQVIVTFNCLHLKMTFHFHNELHGKILVVYVGQDLLKIFCLCLQLADVSPAYCH